VTHYEVLGISRDASTSQVRAAFRRLARAHHPDTSASGSAESLTPINEAWRVLGDPALRRAYDRSLEEDARPYVAEDWAPSPAFEPPPESSFPWRFLAFMAAAGIGIVLLGVFTYTPSKPGPPDNLLEPGSCVVLEDNGDASEVNCDTDHDGVVVNLITADQRCPTDLEPHRDRQGLGVVCIRFDV
jgi:molecular chaperone DnaJ